MAYEIINYDERYRPYDKSGNELKNAHWVKLPAKPKGNGVEKLLDQKKGLEIFGIWCLLLEKTTLEEPENRGKLLNHKGESATPAEIAAGISLKKKVALVEYALSVLVTMGWVKAEVTSAKFPQTSPKSSVVKSSVVKGREGESREGKSLFLNFVYLTEKEHSKLIDRFGESGAAAWIDEMNIAIGKIGERAFNKKYSSHYFTILSWARLRDKTGVSPAKTKLFPIPGRKCEKCKLPAVYKDSSGTYDHYLCEVHMPAEVKAKYQA